VHRSAPKQEIEKPFFYRLLFDHFGVELRMLPTMKERFDNFEQANLQLAINALLERERVGRIDCSASARRNGTN
jgi:hypothetical protein